MTSNRNDDGQPPKRGVAAALVSAAKMISEDKQAFDRFKHKWNDRRTHGGVSSVKRPGKALRSGVLRNHAPGLLAPKFAWLTPEDVPSTPAGLEKFLSNLLACSERRNAAEDLQKAREITLKKWSGTKHTYTLAQHVEALFKLRETSVGLFTAAVLGDFPSAELRLLAFTNVAERHHATVVLARQRIVWGGFDVHRVAAIGQNACVSLTPWFMRLFVKTGTANEYLAGLITYSNLISRIFNAADRAERYERQKVSVRGPKGSVLTSAEIVALPLEAQLSDQDKQDILDSRSAIRSQSDAYRKKFEAIARDENRNNQESLFEWHFGLSEVGALFMTAYRFAEDEAAMIQVIRNPAKPRALFDVTRRVMPQSREQSLVTRTRHLVAAYRPAVLNDIHSDSYKREDVVAAEVSATNAMTFLIRLATANQLSDKENLARDLFDLSHHVRAGRA